MAPALTTHHIALFKMRGKSSGACRRPSAVPPCRRGRGDPMLMQHPNCPCPLRQPTCYKPKLLPSQHMQERTQGCLPSRTQPAAPFRCNPYQPKPSLGRVFSGRRSPRGLPTLNATAALPHGQSTAAARRLPRSAGSGAPPLGHLPANQPAQAPSCHGLGCLLRLRSRLLPSSDSRSQRLEQPATARRGGPAHSLRRV
jgi:hypothetical protein